MRLCSLEFNHNKRIILLPSITIRRHVGAFEAISPDMELAPAKILFVDDASEFCETLAWLLTDEGYACRVAGDGRQAIDMLGQERPTSFFSTGKCP
jgi:PleD family two-component response regulator